MAIRFSKEIQEFIKNNVRGVSSEELAEMVNLQFGTSFTQKQIQAYKKNHKLQSGRPTERKTFYSDTYPKEIADFIHANYKGVGPKEMSEILNREFGRNYTQQQITGYYKNHKLNSGLDGRFKKGQESWIKGKKGIRFEGSEKGWFKKGERPVNVRPVGSERVNVYGYVEIKVAEPNIWRLKQCVVWEQHHGQIPEGHKIIFLDGNKENLDISNLEMITNDEMLEMNRKGLRYDEAELTKTGVLIAKVNRAAEKRKRGNKNSEK